MYTSEHSSILVMGCSADTRNVFREFFEDEGGRVIEVACYEDELQAVDVQRMS